MAASFGSSVDCTLVAVWIVLWWLCGLYFLCLFGLYFGDNKHSTLVAVWILLW